MTRQPERSATIRDVAARCRLSITTVSHVLNERRGRYSLQTAQRVWAAVEELGYQPNHIGRMLRKGNDWLVGALVPNLANAFYADMVCALDRALQKQNRLLLAVSLGEDLAVQEATVKNLRGAMLAGLVVIGTSPQELHHVMTLDHPQAPLVFVNRGSDGWYSSHYTVGIDNYQAGRALGDYFRSHRAKRVAVLRGPDYSYASRQRYEGFLSSIAVPGSGALIIQDEATPLTARAGMVAGPRIVSEAADAVFCGNDMVAMGLTAYLNECRIRVPEDILVSGFDGNSVADTLGKHLVTIEQPMEAMADVMAQWLSGPAHSKALPEHRTLPFQIRAPLDGDGNCLI